MRSLLGGRTNSKEMLSYVEGVEKLWASSVGLQCKMVMVTLRCCRCHESQCALSTFVRSISSHLGSVVTEINFFGTNSCLTPVIAWSFLMQMFWTEVLSGVVQIGFLATAIPDLGAKVYLGGNSSGVEWLEKWEGRRIGRNWKKRISVKNTWSKRLTERQGVLIFGQLHSIAVFDLLWVSCARGVILYTRELLNPKDEYFWQESLT